VIDTQDSTRTVGGELFATESQRRGLAALLIDGPVSVPSPPGFFRALHHWSPQNHHRYYVVLTWCWCDVADGMVVWTVPGHCTDRADGNPRLLHLDPAHLRHRKQNLRDADPDLVRWDHGRSGCENGFCMRYSIDKPRPFAKTGSGQQTRGKVEQKEHRVCVFVQATGSLATQTGSL
jgi:hypothetical protein